MTYTEWKAAMRAHEQDRPAEHLTGILVFTQDSFDRVFPRLSRAYLVGSNNKAFQPNMGGYSIFASCLDGTDPCVRLERLMAAETGRAGDWKIEDCFILEQLRDAAAIPTCQQMAQEDGTTAFFFGGTTIHALPESDAGKIRLKPVRGTQVACGEWVDLEIERVAGYCILLERHLNYDGTERGERYG